MSDLNFTPPEPEPDERHEPEQPLPQLVEIADAPAALFQSWSQPEVVPPTRIPHLGHLALFGAFLLIGAVCAWVLAQLAIHLHLDGVATQDQMATDVRYLLGFEAILYLVTLALSFIVFPFIWNKSFLAGIHWRGATALGLRWRLFSIAFGCIVLAMIDDRLMPGPANAPIDDMFRSPGAAWLMFGFGVTLAPIFEEIAFRGFLLPALSTAWDWAIEINTGRPARLLDANGHPEWSISGMVAASITTSLPFALMHAEQTGWSWGPFVLLLLISLILCGVRLKTRSLAASTLVHACYNFILFSTALISSGGFRHLDKM